jgi:N-acetylneuraminic acid mutarotase
MRHYATPLRSVFSAHLIGIAFLVTACGAPSAPAATSAASPTAALLSSAAVVRDSAWVGRAPMPTPRNAFGTAVVGGKIYVAGGWMTGPRCPDPVGGCWSSAFEAYDPRTDSWSTLPDMPTPRNELAAASAGGHFYAIGGATPAGITGAVEEYDPATNSWRARRAMSAPRWSVSAAVVDSKIYVLGGGVLEVYDPRRDTWTTKAPMPSPVRYWFAAAALDGKVYAIGGSDNPDVFSNTTLYDNVQVYDPESDRWTEKAPLLRRRGLLAAAVAGGRIYAFGGDSWWEVGPFTQMSEAYDPETDAWTPQAPLRTGRNALGAVTLGGTIYTVGGWSWLGPSNVLERYAYPEATITTSGAGCMAWGTDGSGTYTADSQLTVVQGEKGQVSVTCSAAGVFNDSGTTATLSSASLPGTLCLVYTSWLPHLTDWEETITADGHASLRCWYPSR